VQGRVAAISDVAGGVASWPRSTAGQAHHANNNKQRFAFVRIAGWLVIEQKLT